MSWGQWPVAGAAAPLTGLVPPATNILNPVQPVINPAPSVMPPGVQYTPEQWTQMQQQNWQQWAQWQQQYQQWHQQYGAEYQKSMNAINAQMNVQPPLPPAGSGTNTSVPPPLPTEPKPPLPAEEPIKSYSTLPPEEPTKSYSTLPPSTGYSTAPPPVDNWNRQEDNFNNSKFGNNRSNDNWQPMSNNRNQYNRNQMNQPPPNQPPPNQPPPNQPPNQPPPSLLTLNITKPALFDQNLSKRPSMQQTEIDPKRVKTNEPPPQQKSWGATGAHSQIPAATKLVKLEELSEAEKKFDKQFADWEAQFNKWKDQNAGHPDKAQYREYEKKWETWRAQLLERREQMKRKRLSLTAGSPNPSKTAPVPQSVEKLTEEVKFSSKSPILGNAPNQINFSGQEELKFPSKSPILGNAPNQISFSSKDIPSSDFSKPPPNINNEPLVFKKPINIIENIRIEPPEKEKKEFDVSFLKSSSSGDIPGLDLVKENEEAEDDTGQEEEVPEKAKVPDYDALSKGINSILGDKNLLSVLNIVSQNQNLHNQQTAPINTTSKLPNKPIEGEAHELSNSCDDSSNIDQGYFGTAQQELPNTFDDQTRSSFNQNENQFDNFGRPGNFNNRDSGNFDTFAGDGPDNFESDHNQFESFDDNAEKDDFGGGPRNFGRNDDFHPDGDNFNRGPGNFGNRPDFQNRGPNEFNRGPNDFNRGPDNMGPNNFNRGPPGNFNMGPNNFNRGPDTMGPNFNRGPSNVGPNFNRGPDNFKGGPDNMRQDNFNRGPDNIGPGNFLRGPESKAPNNFNRGPDTMGLNNFNRGPDNFKPGSDNLGKDNFNRGADNMGPNNFNRGPDTMGPSNFNRGPDSFNRGPDNMGPNNFNRGPPDNFGRGPGPVGPKSFNNRGPDNFGRGPNNFNRGTDNFNRGPDNFNRGPENFNRGPENFNRGPDNFNRGPDNFNRGSDNFNRGPDNFNNGPDNFNRPPDNFSRGPDNKGPNFNRGPENKGPNNFGSLNTGLGNFGSNNRGPNQNSLLGPGPNLQRGQDNFNTGPNNFNRGNFNRGPQEDFNRGPGNFNRNDNFGAGAPGQFNRASNNFYGGGGPGPDNFNDGTKKGFGNFDEPGSGNNWNTNDNFYDEQNSRFSGASEHFGQEKPNVPLEPIDAGESGPVEVEEVILKPTTVVDYDHKSLKQAEPDVIVEPVQTFDYRHKPARRIPIPQRPKWLIGSFKNIREFDPVFSIKQYDHRRYDDWNPDNRPFEERRIPSFEEDRRKFDDRERRPSSFEEDTRKFDDRRPFEDDKRKYDERRLNFEEGKRKFEDRRSNFDEDKRSIDDRRSNNDRRFEDDRHYREDRRSYDRRSDDNHKSFDEERHKAEKRPGNFENYSQPKKVFEEKSESVVEKPLVIPNKINAQKVMLIEDLLCSPGRFSRAPRIVIILRGPPGSGKTSLAKLIKDKEVENGGSAPRILSLDDYFMVEQEKEVMEEGKRVKIKEMTYEYEEGMEASYRMSLMKSFKKTITDGYFTFIIVDNVNDKVKYFGEMWSFAKQNGFQVYICQLELDVQACSKRNIHGRTEAEIEKCVAGWEPTPSHHPSVDATSLIQSSSIPEVEMEDIDSPPSGFDDDEGVEGHAYTSKWDSFDCSTDNLAKLDGTSKPLRPSRTMEDYLQMEDEWAPAPSTKPGQKRVRWADLEEQKQQEKMRAIGFVVGQTNWDRMLDPTQGGSALTQTKYIERVGKY